MFDWGGFTLFLYILMRISGVMLFSPIFGRRGIPTLFTAGFIGMLSLSAYYLYGGSAPVPDTILEFSLRLLMELAVGASLGLVMRFFFLVAEQGGEVVDTQMGLSMARSYDPSSESNMTITANILNTLMLVLFFIENGHITLLRMVMTSGEIVPFGQVVVGQRLADRALELFAQCLVLSVKLSLPILGAELLGQLGMGVLMKVIPQINVFAINIELKVIIGFFMLVMLLAPMSEFLLSCETEMLRALRSMLMLLQSG